MKQRERGLALHILACILVEKSFFFVFVFWIDGQNNVACIVGEGEKGFILPTYLHFN